MAKKRGERHEKAFQLLVAAGYRRNWEVELPNECGTCEQWIGPRGCLFVQVLRVHRADEDSVSIAHEGGVPNRWDEIETWLASDGRESPDAISVLNRIVAAARLVPCKDGGQDAEAGEGMAAGKWRVESAIDGWIAEARSVLEAAGMPQPASRIKCLHCGGPSHGDGAECPVVATYGHA